MFNLDPITFIHIPLYIKYEYTDYARLYKVVGTHF